MATNVFIGETTEISVVKVNTDISNSVWGQDPLFYQFNQIKFSSITVDGTNASGKLDVSANMGANQPPGTEYGQSMSVYIYEREILASDFDDDGLKNDLIFPKYPITVLTPYSEINSFNDVSGNFVDLPLNTTLYLYLVTGSSSTPPDYYVNFKYVDFKISIEPSLTSITPFGGLVTGGADFTLTGDGLNTVNSVKFGTVTADNFTITNSTTITGKTPAQADTDDGLQLIYINDLSSNDVSFNYYLEASFNELVTAALEKINFPAAPTDTSGVEIVNISSVGVVTSTYETLELSNDSKIADYFSLLSNYDNSNNDYLAARQTMVNALFDKPATEYPGADPSLNSIIINSGDFPFSKTEKQEGMVSNPGKYKLVDYRQQNYTVIDFSYQDEDTPKTNGAFFNYMNNNNLSTYVPIPTTDKSEFTFVFNNTILAKYYGGCCGEYTHDIDETGTGNIYAKIDVSNGDENTPTYRVRAFFSYLPLTDVNTLDDKDDKKPDTSGNFYIITDPGINGNWAAIDGKEKYAEDASYNKYDIIQYNGVDVNDTATGKVDALTFISSTSTGGAEYRKPQEKINMTLNIDIGTDKQKLELKWNFIMGSLIFGTIKGGITNNTNTIFNPTELGGGFSGISPKPIVLVERGNQRGMSRMTLRRAGYQDVNSFIANNPGYNTNYIIQGGQAVKNKAFLKQDSSERTRQLKLKAENLTYNDLTFGGDKNNGSYTARSRARY